MDRVLIDSDVVLDALYKRVPFDKFAAEIISLCEFNLIEGYLTPVIIANVYYILRQKVSHEEVIEKLSELLEITDVLVINKSTILEAANSEFSDFEDALQYFAAAQSKKIGIILTRNVKDYKNSKIRVMTPEAYLEARSDSHD